MIIKSHTFKFLIEAYKEWVKDRAKGMAPALAYYEILALAPLTGFLIFISNKILGSERTHEDVIPLLKNWFTPQFVKVITFMLTSIEKIKATELYTLSVISGLTLAWGTKEYFGQIKDTIEIIWNQRRDKFGFKVRMKKTIEDIQVAAVSLLIIVVFIFLRSILPHPNITPEESAYEKGFFVHLIQGGTQFIFLFSLFFYFFTFVTPLKVYWKNTIPGAALGALLYVIGREIMKTHMYANPDVDVAESFIVVLIWFYYANLVFVYAAEFNKVYVADRQNIDVNNLKYDE